MIIGLISDFARQKSVLPAAVVRALEAIQKVDPLKMEPGKYEVEGDKLFFLVQDVELRTLAESRAEAHKQYADIQLPYSTPERYGFALPQPELPSKAKISPCRIDRLTRSTAATPSKRLTKLSVRKYASGVEDKSILAIRFNTTKSRCPRQRPHR